MSARDLIQSIGKGYLNSDQLALESLAGAIDRLKKAFPRYGSFLMEFVQNADDAQSNSLKIEIGEDAIRIANDGLPFDENDVRSICKVGRSSKSATEYIGYLGVGFKSVFLISESPEIYSDEYRFRFDRSAWPDSRDVPWQVIPIWLDDPALDLSVWMGYTTVFNLPLVPGSVERIRPETTPEHLNSRILLFLRHINQIEIRDATQDTTRRMARSQVSKTSRYEIIEIAEYVNDGAAPSRERWLVFRAARPVPKNVRMDYTSKEWERQDVRRREIVAAFRLNDDGNLVREEGGTAHIGVFSFLPLKEIPAGLSFLLQGDLLTAPGRGELARDCLWNTWLADQMYELIIGKCIPVFLNSKEWRMHFTDILYSSGGAHQLFKEHVTGPLNDYLQTAPVLVAEDGTAARAVDLIAASEEVRQLATHDDLRLIHPDKRLLHPDCRPHPALGVTRLPGDLYEFIRSSDTEAVLRSRATSKDLRWFTKLYRTLAEHYSHDHFYAQYAQYNAKHDQFWNRLRRLSSPIILTNRYSTVSIDEAYVKPEKLRIPRELTGRFTLVHPEVARDDGFMQFRRKLNEDRHLYSRPEKQLLRELTPFDIQSALREQQALDIDALRWKELRSDERTEWVTSIKRLWSQDELSLESYGFLTLKSKAGQWLDPDKLVFPGEYLPDGHSLETLGSKGLLDLPIHYLSPEFIEHCADDDEIREWREFFEHLGVDGKLKGESAGWKKRIVERVGILTTLQYEERNGRTPKELGESRRPGYDIESGAGDVRRYIEVKSSSDTSRNIFLTNNEFRALQQYGGEYFIYFVLDALDRPTLYAIQGDALLDIEELNIVVAFARWREVVGAVYQP